MTGPRALGEATPLIDGNGASKPTDNRDQQALMGLHIDDVRDDPTGPSRLPLRAGYARP